MPIFSALKDRILKPKNVGSFTDMRNIPDVHSDSDNTPDSKKPIKIRKKSQTYNVSLYKKAEYGVGGCGDENVWPADLGKKEGTTGGSKKRSFEDVLPPSKTSTRKVIKRLSNASPIIIRTEPSSQSYATDAKQSYATSDGEAQQERIAAAEPVMPIAYRGYDHDDDQKHYSDNSRYDHTANQTADAKDSTDDYWTGESKSAAVEEEEGEKGVDYKYEYYEESKNDIGESKSGEETTTQYSYDYNSRNTQYDEKDAEQEEGDRWERVHAVFSKVRHDRRDAVKEALDIGFDPYSVDENGNTMLHICAQNNLKKMASELIRRGCFINALNKKKSTPLDYCDSLRYTVLGEWLVSKGAERGPLSQFVDPLRC